MRLSLTLPASKTDCAPDHAQIGKRSEKRFDTSDEPASPPASSSLTQYSADSNSTIETKEFLLVIDLEATCEKGVSWDPQEIIEVACVVVDVKSRNIEGEFQQYVRPTERRQLTDFCVQLTGITQDRVDNGLPLEDALARLDSWLREGMWLGKGRKVLPVTWSDWDLKIQVETECKWRKLNKPQYLSHWADLRTFYIKAFGRKPRGLKAGVEAAGLVWEGQLHSGLDDARNTARLAAAIMAAGTNIRATGSFNGKQILKDRMRQTTLTGFRPAKARKVTDSEGQWNGKCSCGVLAHLRTTRKPGPNHGRQFYSCGRWSIIGGGKCSMFKWKEEVVMQPAQSTTVNTGP